MNLYLQIKDGRGAGIPQKKISSEATLMSGYHLLYVKVHIAVQCTVQCTEQCTVQCTVRYTIQCTVHSTLVCILEYKVIVI